MYRKVHGQESLEGTNNFRKQHQIGTPLTASPSFTSKSNLSTFDSSSLVGSESSNYSRFSKNYSRSQHKSVTRPYQHLDIDSENVTPVKIRFENYVNRFAAHDIRSSSPACGSEPQDLQQDQPPNRTPSPSIPPRVSVSDYVDRFGGKRQTNSPAMHSKNSQDIKNARNHSSIEFSKDEQDHNKNQRIETKKYNREYQTTKKSSMEVQNIHRIRTGGSTSTATTSTNTSAMQEPKWRQQSSTPDTQKSDSRDTEISPMLSKTPPAFVSSTPNTAPVPSRNMSRRQRSKSIGQSTEEVTDNAKVSVLREKLWNREEQLQVSIPPTFKYSINNPMEAEAREQRRQRLSRSLSPDRPQYRNSQFNSRYYMAAIASHRLRRTGSHGTASEQPQQEVRQEYQDQQLPSILRSQQGINENSPAIRTSRSSDAFPAGRSGYLPSPKFQPSPFERQRVEKSFTESQTKQSPHVDSTDERENNYRSFSESPAVSTDRFGKKEESETVSKLIAKLNSINRSNPAEALAQIDSILNSESGISPGGDPAPKHNLPNAETRAHSSEDESEDDETSVSSITNPTYSGGKMVSSSSSSRQPRPNALQNFQPRNMVRTEEQKRLEKLERKNRPPPPGTINVVKDNVIKEGDSLRNRGKLDQHLQKTKHCKSSSAADIAMKIRMWDEMSSSTGKRSASSARKSFVSLNDASEEITATTSELGSLITPAQSESNEAPVQDPVISPDEETEPELLNFQCGVPKASSFRCDDPSLRFGSHEEIRGHSKAYYESPKTVDLDRHSNMRRHPWDYKEKLHKKAPQLASHTTEYWTEPKKISDQLQVRPNSSGRQRSNKLEHKNERHGSGSDSFTGNDLEMDPNDGFAPKQKDGVDENFVGFPSEFDAAWESLSPGAFDNGHKQMKTSTNAVDSIHRAKKELKNSLRPQQDRAAQIPAEKSNSNERGNRSDQEQNESEIIQGKGRNKLNLFNQNRGGSKSPGRRGIIQRFNRRKKDAQV
mmetsp:Transcript_17514/g.25914  ORF Transcript_17514/g.25914 Transcript_17514/m.25914 type:complete len:995 (-) Transcript_17514:34-3018(-)